LNTKKLQSIFQDHALNQCMIFIIILLIFSCHISSGQNIYFLKGRAFEMNSQVDSALLYYSKAIEQSVQDARFYLARGKVYFKTIRYNDALIDFNQANNINTDIADFEIAKCYAKQKNTNEVIHYLKKHLVSRYKLNQSTLRMEPAFAYLENSTEWKNLWSTEWYDRYDMQVGEARFMINNKDWMGAINYISNILTPNSKHHELLGFLGKAYFEMGNYTTSANMYSEAIEIFKRNYEYFEGRSEAFKKLDKMNQSLADLNSAIELAPDMFQLYLKRSEFFFASEKYEKAKNDIDFYLSFFENDSSAVFLAGKIAIATNNYIKALEYYNSLLKVNPEKPAYYLARAEAYEKTGLVPNALKDYNVCLSIEPLNTLALKKRGLILFAKGNKKTACSDWLKAMNMGYVEATNLYQDNCK
jgi:tetratricopeptide (TPR) repeat protein